MARGTLQYYIMHIGCLSAWEYGIPGQPQAIYLGARTNDVIVLLGFLFSSTLYY